MPASSLHTLVALAAVADAFSPAAQTKPRHLVLIVADDLGYADLGYTGSEIRTPNIDGLANSGVDMFTELQPPYVRGTRTSRLRAVRTRGAGQLAPGATPASLLRLWYGHRPCTRGDTPKAVCRVPCTPQANSGVKLGNFYVQRACSPTRAALLTGRYNIRYGFQSGVLTDHNNYSLPLTETLLPQFVQRTRAAKAHAVGKWHLGYHRWEHTPTFRGFDSYLGCALRSPNPARYSEPEPEPKLQPKLSPKPEPKPMPKPRPNSQTIRATRTTSRTTAAAAASIFTWPTRLASE